MSVKSFPPSIGNTALALPRYTEALIRRAPATLPQWLFPGPNSRHVRAASKVAAPDYTLADATAVFLPSYQVPDGMIFSMRGISLLAFVQSWNQASGDLLFTLSVTSGGTRNVDYLINIDTELGSTQQPFPIGGRLEFEPLETLSMSVFAPMTSTASIGPPNWLECVLWGHLYPAAERTDGD